jgi:hypothetical protein
LLVGLGFAWCARVQFLGGATPWGRELAAVLSFEAIIVWPISLYYFLVFPDWSWMYLVDPDRLPRGVSVLVLLAFASVLVGGYLVGWALLRANREKWLWGALGGAALALLLIAVLCRRRLFASGTFAEYHAGHALSVGESKLSWSMGITIIAIGAAASLVGFTLYEQGKRFRS